MNKSKMRTKISALIPELFVVLACSFMLIIYGPVEVFYTNSFELYYSIIDVLKYMFPVFLISAIAMLAIFASLAFLNKKIEFIVFLIAFAGMIAVYIQGTVLSSNLPPLNGVDIKWEEYKADNIKSIVMIAIAIGAVCFAYHLLALKKSKKL